MPSVHLDSLMVAVQRHARYEVHAVQMGGRLARLNLDVKLEQQFASCSVNGIALATQRQASETPAFAPYPTPYPTPALALPLAALPPRVHLRPPALALPLALTLALTLMPQCPSPLTPLLPRTGDRHALGDHARVARVAISGGVPDSLPSECAIRRSTARKHAAVRRMLETSSGVAGHA